MRTSRMSSRLAPGAQSNGNRSRLPIAVLPKGIAVLEAVASATDGISVKRLVEITGLDRATVHRVLRTLLEDGLVQRAERGAYSVAPRGVALGLALSSNRQLGAAAMPTMRRLMEATGETVTIAVLDDTEVLYVERLPARKMLSVNLAVGSRLPAYCTSHGRAILAFMPREEALDVLCRSDLRRRTPRTIVSIDKLLDALDTVRRQGWALGNAELEPELRAVAAPIRGPDGMPVAAINVAVPGMSVGLEAFRRHLVPPLLVAAEELSGQLGFGDGASAGAAREPNVRPRS